MSDTQIPSTIYIVDDDEAVRDSLRWLLEANGYAVR
ncbi:MAG: DNA-binding response regulator, partial [Castellaniella sp.]